MEKGSRGSTGVGRNRNKMMPCSLPYDLESRRRNDKMYQDMYEGNGKDNPPIVTRLFDVERTITDLRRLKWYLVAAIVTGLGDIIFAHIK